MSNLRFARLITSAVGIALGLASAFGAIILIWASQDAMLVLIHRVGEAQALGPENVILQPDGSKLLTNPSAMAKWVMTIWAVGFSQFIAGLHLLWKSCNGLKDRGKRLR